jgi:hypothetical protein
MKKYRSTIILFIALLILAVTYLFLTGYKKNGSQKLLDLKNNVIREIMIISAKGKTVLMKESGEWKFSDPQGYMADRSKIDILEKGLYALESVRTLKNDNLDMKVYGLNDPVSEINIKTADNQNKIIKIGYATPSKDAYYVQVSGDRNVFIVKKGDVDDFLEGPDFFRDKSIITMNVQKLKTIEINDANRNYQFTKKTDGFWEFDKPVKAGIKNDVMTEILDKLIGLKISEFIKPSSDIGFFLERPDYNLALTDENENKQIINFGKKGNEYFYVNIKGTKDVFTINSLDFSPENLFSGELINEAPLSISLDDIDRIKINDDGRITEIVRNKSKQGNVFSIGGTDIKQEDFTSFYINIMAVSAEGFELKPVNKTLFSITLEENKNGLILNTEFSKRNENTYNLRIDSKPSYLFVSAKKIDLVRKWMKRISTY